MVASLFSRPLCVRHSCTLPLPASSIEAALRTPQTWGAWHPLWVHDPEASPEPDQASPEPDQASLNHPEAGTCWRWQSAVIGCGRVRISHHAAVTRFVAHVSKPRSLSVQAEVRVEAAGPYRSRVSFRVDLGLPWWSMRRRRWQQRLNAALCWASALLDAQLNPAAPPVRLVFFKPVERAAMRYPRCAALTQPLPAGACCVHQRQRWRGRRQAVWVAEPGTQTQPDDVQVEAGLFLKARLHGPHALLPLAWHAVCDHAALLGYKLDRRTPIRAIERYLTPTLPPARQGEQITELLLPIRCGQAAARKSRSAANKP